MVGSFRIRDVMSEDVVKVDPRTPIGEVAQLFLARAISAAPVVDLRGKVMGIVTLTDLARAQACGHHLPDLLFADAEGERGWSPEAAGEVEDLVAGDIMTADPRTISPECWVADAAREMVEERFHHLVVTDGDELVGMVSSLDLAALVAHAVPARHVPPEAQRSRAA